MGDTFPRLATKGHTSLSETVCRLSEYSAVIPGGDVAALRLTLLKRMATGMGLELSQGPSHEANIGISGVG